MPSRLRLTYLDFSGVVNDPFGQSFVSEVEGQICEGENPVMVGLVKTSTINARNNKGF